MSVDIFADSLLNNVCVRGRSALIYFSAGQMKTFTWKALIQCPKTTDQQVCLYNFAMFTQ